VAISLADEPIVVCGDADRLQQVVGNLLNNASKYTPPGGTVWLTVAREDREAVVSVRDNGPGIVPERLDSIFDPFTRGTTGARTEGGLGIGLTVVKRLVTLHGGTVHAHSDGRGAGATFTVRLPLATQPLGRMEPPATRVSTPRRIVVIEDDDDSRDALVVALRVEGHEVRAARLGREGVELALREQPNLVLIDIGLPDVTGYEAARLLRGKLGQEARLVALTGYGQPEDRIRSAQAGFEAHLVKPVAADDVLRLLAAAL
jgi:CheY-like chemotaxis protein/anti-sigma regulatory factor (Ser/Thr protein kinase)